jgi:integrase
MPDTKNLEKRRLAYYAVLDVPVALRPIIGRARLRKSLKTRSLAVAQRERHAVLAEFQTALKAARAKLGGSDVVSEALGWRLHLEKADRNPIELVLFDGSSSGQFTTDRETVSSLLGDRADEIADALGDEAARDFVSVATGRATPLTSHFEDWLRDSLYKGRTEGDHRRAVERLSSWMTGSGHATILEIVSRKVAGQFVMKGLGGSAIAPKTVNKYVSSLSSYWAWLEKRGFVETNPWQRQGVSKKTTASASGEEKERAFTSDEMKRLLTGTDDKELSEVIRLLALTGMRIEELYQLRVGDVLPNGCFQIRASKTNAGVRPVPIHSALQGIVAGLTHDRPADAFLMENGSGSAERSMAMSKRFGRYRETVGVDAKVPGKRRSLVNAHSFRRWFITTAEQAGQTENIIASVVGHKRPGMTFGTYSSGPSVDQFRVCVEAVKLPAI